MVSLVSVAWRNISRSRARSALTVAAILFSVLMSVLFGAFIYGFQDAVLDDTINGRVGAIQVHRRGYFDLKESQPLRLDLEQSAELEARIASVPGVRGVTPRLLFAGLVSNGSSATTFMGQGIDAARELPLMNRASPGVPVSAERPQSGVVSAELANALGVQPGGSLVLQATTQRNRENAVDLDVGGLDRSTSQFDSKRLISVPLAFAQQLLRMPGRVTEYVVSIDERDDVDAVAERLRASLGGEYEAHTWLQLRPGAGEVVEVLRVVMFFICIVFLLLAVFGVVNTQLMSVAERTREIGTMLALGVRRAQVGALFVMEAAMQALLGAGVGIVLAFALISQIRARGGLRMKLLGREDLLVIVPTLTAPLAVLALSLCIFGALIGAVHPARRAAGLRPVDALRAL